MRRDPALPLNRLESITESAPVVVRPLPRPGPGGEHRLRLGRDRLDTSAQQQVSSERRQGEDAEPARRLRVRLSPQPLLLEIDERARDGQSRMVTEVDVILAESEHLGNSQSGPEHHVHGVEQFTPPQRSAIASPVLPFAEPFAERAHFVDCQRLDRFLRLRRKMHVAHWVQPDRIVTDSELEHAVEHGSRTPRQARSRCDQVPEEAIDAGNRDLHEHVLAQCRE